jgi:hypothetical protein
MQVRKERVLVVMSVSICQEEKQEDRAQSECSKKRKMQISR